MNPLNLVPYLCYFVMRLVMGLHWWVKMKCMPARSPHRGGDVDMLRSNLNLEDYFLKSNLALELFSCFNPPTPLVS